MADLDTLSKRGSAINCMSPWRRTLPIPTGTVDQAARQQNAYLYTGILAGGGPPPATGEGTGPWTQHPWIPRPHSAPAAGSPWSFSLPSPSLSIGGFR